MEHARVRPSAVAVDAPDGRLGFAQLVERTERIASALRRAGAGPDFPVGVCLGNSRNLVPSLLAVWLVGATFVPLDARHPAERNHFVLRDAGAGLLLTTGELAPAFGGAAAQIVRICDAVTSSRLAGPPVEVRADACAYVIYTSGTTGHPKGVEISYRGLSAFLSALADLGLPAGGGLGINAVSPSFDGWLWCVLLYLTHGHGVALLDLADAGQDGDISALINGAAPRIVSLTPSILAHCEHDIPTAEVLVLAGEASSPALVRRWCRGRRLLNVYGPTETTIAAAWADTARGDDASTIGRALPGYRTYVLDADLRKVPPGGTGELYVGGPGVARGYRNQPGRTAASFLPDPFADDGTRMYRTGDLVRVRGDGLMAFVGRGDEQVKIRGFRVELAEIERVIAEIPDALAVAAFPRAAGAALGAAVVSVPSADASDLRQRVSEHCAQRLPDFMRPGLVSIVASLPVSPSGKVDRAALAELMPEPGEARAPVTQREREVAEVWEQFLAQPVTDVDGNFFDLGGHSLAAARVVSALRRSTGQRLNIGHLLANPTVAALATMIDSMARAGG